SGVPFRQTAHRSTGLAQRIAAVDHRLHLAGSDQLAHGDEILHGEASHEEAHLLATKLPHRRSGHGADEPAPHVASVRSSAPGPPDDPAGLQYAAVLSDRVIRRQIEDEVVTLAATSEILARVIEHAAGSE